MVIVSSIAVLGLMGFVFAALLGYAADYFYVEEDPRVSRVLAALPAGNCGACGLAGCRDYAEKVVAGEADPNACRAGGAATAEAIASIMGLQARALAREVAVVHCRAGETERKRKGRYTGIRSCSAATLVDGGGLACAYGCLGYGDCREACAFDAIAMQDGLPVVDREKCTGCGKCVQVCPRNILGLAPEGLKVAVACSSRDPGPAVRKICAVGCIGCKLCVKQAPGLFSVERNLAVIDASKTDAPFEAAWDKCPTKCIVTFQ